MAWSVRRFLGLDEVTAAELNQLRTNLNDHLRLHTHSGTDGDGASKAGWETGASFLGFTANYVQSNNTGSDWATFTEDASCEFGGYLQNTVGPPAQNNFIEWDLPLTSGTWRFDLLHTTASDNGIYTVTLEGVSLGTIDGYSAATTRNVASSITGFTVAAQPRNTLLSLRFTMATKHASSTGYRGRIQFISMRRTGA